MSLGSKMTGKLPASAMHCWQECKVTQYRIICDTVSIGFRIRLTHLWTGFESHWGQIQWQCYWCILPCLILECGLPQGIKWTGGLGLVVWSWFQSFHESVFDRSKCLINTMTLCYWHLGVSCRVFQCWP